MSDTDAAEPQRPLVRLFADPPRARRAIEALKAANVPPDAISVLSRSTRVADELERSTGTSGELEELTAEHHHPLADVMDWLGRIESVVVPGFGAVLGTGNLWQDLAFGTGTRGAITAALVGLGLPIEEAGDLEHAVRGGDLLLVVRPEQSGVSPERLASILDEDAESAAACTGSGGSTD